MYIKLQRQDNDTIDYASVASVQQLFTESITLS